MPQCSCGLFSKPDGLGWSAPRRAYAGLFAWYRSQNACRNFKHYQTLVLSIEDQSNDFKRPPRHALRLGEIKWSLHLSLAAKKSRICSTLVNYLGSLSRCVHRAFFFHGTLKWRKLYKARKKTVSKTNWQPTLGAAARSFNDRLRVNMYHIACCLPSYILRLLQTQKWLPTRPYFRSSCLVPEIHFRQYRAFWHWQQRNARSCFTEIKCLIMRRLRVKTGRPDVNGSWAKRYVQFVWARPHTNRVLSSGEADKHKCRIKIGYRISFSSKHKRTHTRRRMCLTYLLHKNVPTQFRSVQPPRGTWCTMK